MDQIEVGIAGGVDSASDAPVAISEQLRRLVLGLNRAKGSLARLRVSSRLRPSMLIPLAPNVNAQRTGFSAEPKVRDCLPEPLWNSDQQHIAIV
jgi:acetyl-CoA C-acetyltransferase